MNAHNRPNELVHPEGNPGTRSGGLTAQRKRAPRRFPWGTMLFLVAIAYFQWPMLKGVFYRASGIDAPESSIAWREDFDSAAAEAKASDKPLLLVFSASWCPPCKVMKHEVWPDAAVGRVVSRDFVPVYVDVDDAASAAVARRYSISGIPAVLVVDANGDVIRQESYMSRSTALAFLATDAS